MRQKPGQRLSQEGVELARRVGAELGPYDAVLTSDLARAVETAVAMGFAVGATCEELGAYPETLPDAIHWPASLDEIRRSLSGLPGISEMASRQAACWKGFLKSLPEGGNGLIVTHGALLEIGAIALLGELGMPVEGPAFAYCEGLRIRLDGATIEAVEQVRLPDGQRLVSN